MRLKTLTTRLLACLALGIAAQTAAAQDAPGAPPPFRVMFYNCENLFDNLDDPGTIDQEYLPGGERGWTPWRIHDKQFKIAQVILSVGGWEPPAVVGLCEVENRAVLEQLLDKTGLRRLGYQLVHQESPDRRGIDVAMFYRPEAFQLLDFRYHRVINPADSAWATRDVLHARGTTPWGDTLHLFFNHWPSRWGGQFDTQDKRQLAANTVRAALDSVLASEPQARVVIMGDLNDYPDDLSVTQTLGALHHYDQPRFDKLYNLSAELERQGLGSHKYQYEWGVLDQTIVSGALLLGHGSRCAPSDAHIQNADFLLEDDPTYLGQKVSRTYIGFRYHGGFSDHLPIYLELRPPANSQAAN